MGSDYANESCVLKQLAFLQQYILSNACLLCDPVSSFVNNTIFRLAIGY